MLHDINGDGICCAHRYGWMSILGNEKIVWSNNGEFQNDVSVYFRLHTDGSFEILQSQQDGKQQDLPQQSGNSSIATKDEQLHTLHLDRNETSITDKQ